MSQCRVPSRLLLSTEGMLDQIPVKNVRRFEKEYLEFLDNKYKNVLDQIQKEKELSDELKEALKKSAEEFMKIFKVEE